MKRMKHMKHMKTGMTKRCENARISLKHAFLPAFLLFGVLLLFSLPVFAAATHGENGVDDGRVAVGTHGMHVSGMRVSVASEASSVRGEEAAAVVADVEMEEGEEEEGEEEAWGGTDDAASEAVEHLNPNYEPWFSPVWEPPSGEIESFLFTLQASIGAVVIGFVIGYYKGKKDAEKAGKE
ncbi:MAG: energy-coupling factor ABC transporter substrate-binding protein [Candidatus Methanospirare jalkutatii]|nr:energy-coupling factor ABC transporter substrate-binding protein [Candidatus Methanospirare jalkutatii]